MTNRLFLFLLLTNPASLLALDSQQFSIPPGRRQLFLDDHTVDKIVNLTRTLHHVHAKKIRMTRFPIEFTSCALI